jgi:MFS family permease
MVGLVSAIRIGGGGLHQFGFTVFFLPISQDLGISRAATSLAFSLSRAQGAIEAPLVGYLIDRYGPRPITVTAALCGEVTGPDHRRRDLRPHAKLNPSMGYPV